MQAAGSWWRGVFVLLLALGPGRVGASAPPAAPALYKCVDAGGHASYQSPPCPDGSRQAWQRDATPDAAPTPPVAAVQARPQSRPRAAAPRPSVVRARTPAAQPAREGSSDAACRRARAADAAYRAQPLARVRHDGLRRHGDRIRAACGPWR